MKGRRSGTSIKRSDLPGQPQTLATKTGNRGIPPGAPIIAYLTCFATSCSLRALRRRSSSISRCPAEEARRTAHNTVLERRRMMGLGRWSVSKRRKSRSIMKRPPRFCAIGSKSLDDLLRKQSGCPLSRGKRGLRKVVRNQCTVMANPDRAKLTHVQAGSNTRTVFMAWILLLRG